MAAARFAIRLNHVPFSDGRPAITAVLAPQIQPGAMRTLINTGSRRSTLLPDVPTAMELGFACVEFYLWVGLFSQTATPAPIQQAWKDGITAISRQAEFLRQLQTAGLDLKHREGQEFLDFLEADRRRVTAAVHRIGRVE